MSASHDARPLAGARVLLAALLALALPAGAGAAPPEAAPLPWRVPGRVGFTVDAAAFPDSAGVTLDVFVRVSPTTLVALERDSTGQGRLRLTTRLRSAYGGKPQEQVQEFALAAADSAGGLGKVVAVRFPTKPGRHHLFVRMDDALSRKRGLIYSGRNVTESGQAEGDLVVPAAEEGRALSGLEFVWASHPGGPATTFERGGRTLLPDPERLYGLYGSTLRAAFSARGDSARAWRWRWKVADHDGAVIAQQESSAVAQPWLHGEITADIATEPAGDYRLELEVGQEGDAQPMVRRESFSIAWQVDSWLRNPRDIQDDVHFLLSADAEDDFALLSPGAQERYLDDFWRERDPSPGTGVNEARLAFLQRVTYANQHWSHPALGKGMFSDMGRVFIRYGEPSEVITQVIATGDDGLDQMLQEIAQTEDRPIGDVPAKGPGADIRSFEVWKYEGPIPQPPDADPKSAGHPRQKHLLFLFVDEHGTGDFRLRYTTE